MAQEQRDMDTGNQGRTGKDNQSRGSGMGSHPGMGRTDSGMGGMQRGSEGLGGQSQGTSSDMGNQGGLGSDRMDNDDDLQIEGGDAGRGSSSGSGRTQGGNMGEGI